MSRAGTIGRSANTGRPAGPRGRRTVPRPPSAADSHRAWLALVDSDGPFLAIPPLKRVWPNGFPDFRRTSPERFETLTDARRPFESAWEALDRDPGDEALVEKYRLARDEFVETVLRDVVGWAELLRWGMVPGIEAQSPNQAVTVTGQAALAGPDGLGALVLVVDPADSLREVPGDLWAATPVDRCEALLRAGDVQIGIVTDGRWWGLVCARPGAMAASGIVDALTWTEEPRVRDAFLALIGCQHIIGGDPAERLPELFRDSVAAAEEITEALGTQVRRAVELLIQSLGEAAADAARRGMPDPLPAQPHYIYEAAVTVLMRTVFLLFAEERGLLPGGELFEQGYGIARELARLTALETEESEEALEATSLTWHRLLATSQALYRGASFENLRMPAYGGSLFDPARFPFLTAATEQGGLAVTVPDRVMLHVLRSVQVAQVKGEARQISFRDIDVEQIGYIYEGLLGYTVARIDQTNLGLIGATGNEPEIPLATLEDLSRRHSDPRQLAAAIRDWAVLDQPASVSSSVAAIARAITAEPDPAAVSALTQATGEDHELRDRIRPWLGVIRPDLRSRPFVVLPGGLLVRETPSRKNAGAHYTPSALAAEVVLYALEPLCYSPGPHQTADRGQWRLKSSDDLLGLKVADIACGSGAFLVAAARYLAGKVTEAWTSEDPANVGRKDLHLRAIRKVVANCLYGADINDMAVEMCKLSLWLVSLDRDLPFSFVDDKIFLGNSLLGLTSLDQIRKLHIDPARVPPTELFDIFDVDTDVIIRHAVNLRERLTSEIDETDPARSSAAKHRQLAELRRVTASLREIADGVIAAGLPLGGKPAKALDDAYANLRLAIKKAHPDPGAAAPDRTWISQIIDHGLTPTVHTDYRRWRPLHWILEAPDVLVEHGGFDAIVGNPPFLGGKKITGAMGTDIRDWLVEVLAGGARGSADLVAYFFLRAATLLGRTGTLGLIATNTVAQGDTREVGLDRLVRGGFTIIRAIQSRSWPAASVNLEYAAVWGTLGQVADGVVRIADDVSGTGISAFLEHEGRVEGNAVKLAENVGLGFVGCNINGTGFEVPPTIAAQMITEDHANKRVLLPLLGGEDVNGLPDLQAPMWVIDFYGMELAEASDYCRPFEWVKNNVLPHRKKMTNKPKLQERWWRYERDAIAMRRAISKLDSALVISLVSRSVMPVRVPAGQIFSHALGVFAVESFADQAVLSSSLHQIWAIKYGSGMRNDPRYTPSDVFETFPRPKPTEWLERIGRTLDEERREVMLRRELGLTKLYNLINDPTITDVADPDVERLQGIHVELDGAVMDAYGWSDIPLEHGFHKYRQMRRWTVSPTARVEIMDRLLEENHHCAKAEAAAPTSIRHRRSARAPEGTETLFS